MQEDRMIKALKKWLGWMIIILIFGFINYLGFKDVPSLEYLNTSFELAHFLIFIYGLSSILGLLALLKWCFVDN